MRGGVAPGGEDVDALPPPTYSRLILDRLQHVTSSTVRARSRATHLLQAALAFNTSDCGE